MGQVQRVTRAESPRCLAMDKTKIPCRTTPLSINSWKMTASLSCVSAPSPEKQQNQIKRCHGWHQDQLHWLMTSCPGTNQCVETMTLRGHTGTTDEYSMEILPWDFQVKGLRTGSPWVLCSLSVSFSRACLHLSSLFHLSRHPSLGLS